MTLPDIALALDPIPSRLRLPAVATSQIRPPVITLVGQLPFGELAWEDFERLCLQLARHDSVLEGCRLYGHQGDAQAGIDLYARETGEDKYRVYQCKRVRGFGAAAISAAVDVFLNPTPPELQWHSRTKTFVLCTSESLRAQKRDDEFQTQKDRLKALGIELVRWDAEELNHLLKDLPEIVYDFFGKAWVEFFCGSEAVHTLVDRLSSTDLQTLRRELGSLYASVFDQHDSGMVLTDAAAGPLPTLRTRFVMPDILDPEPSSPVTSQPSQPIIQESEDDLSMFSSDRPSRRRLSRRALSTPSVYERRRPCEEWLTGKGEAVLLGGPGSGKSTLLRYLVLDLLSDAPTLKVSGDQWAGYLPIWVPFAYWTRMISSQQGGTLSLSDVMRSWLHAFDSSHLARLLDQALRDKRLLLVVDGLDEYAQVEPAGLALDRLRVFTQERQVPVVLSSRPEGYELFKGSLGGWASARLADLSPAQQRRLAYTWVEYQVRSALPGSTEDLVAQRVNAEIETFFDDLADSPDLSQLARVPLLLCLLISLRRAEVTLPTSRFSVYENVVKHLLEIHPKRRLRAASVAEAQRALTPAETLEAYAYLGYHLQCHHPEGLISDSDAVEAFTAFFQDVDTGLGLQRPAARRAAEDLITVGETSVGLLVRRSPHDIGFFHRTLQEFLASRHLSRLEDGLRVFAERRTEPQWSEVLLGTMWLTRPVQQVRQMVAELRAPGGTVRQRHHLAALLAEAAFGEFNVPPGLALEIASSTLAAIEQETWQPQRERLLNHALSGLQSARVREGVQQRLKQWFPERFMARSYVLRAMGNWPSEEETTALLLRGLYDEELENRTAAAYALVQIGSQEPELIQRLFQIADQAHSVAAQAGALRTLAVYKDASQIAHVQTLFQRQALSPNTELRLLAYVGLAQLGLVTEAHLQDLLPLLDNELELDRQDFALLASALVQGWPGNLEVRDRCLRASRLGEMQWRVLFAGFSSDALVIQRVVQELTDQEHPFILYDSALIELSQTFKDVPEIVQAIDHRIQRGGFVDRPRELYFAALVGRTEAAKAALIAGLEESFIHWSARGLIEGWGINDTEVRSHLLPFLASGDQAGQIAFLIPEILEQLS